MQPAALLVFKTTGRDRAEIITGVLTEIKCGVELGFIWVTT